MGALTVPQDGAQAAFAAALAGMRLVDLTHPMHQGMPVWPSHPPFYAATVESYRMGGVAFHRALFFGEHAGTHIDAPVHFIEDGATVAQIPPERLVGRMRTIDAIGVGGLVSPELIETWEGVHGAIETDDAVFFHFGWDEFWRSPETYPRVVKDWPGLSGAAAKLLLQRRVRMVGSDCLAIDRFGEAGDPVHRALLGGGVLIAENFDRLGELPPTCHIVVLPLRFDGGSGSPVRAVAFVPR